MEKLAPSIIGLMGTLIGAFFVVLGWVVSHWLTVTREITAKRREQHLNFLIPTYRTLSKLIPYTRAGRAEEIDDDLQSAMADLQFLGTPEQIQMAQDFMNNAVQRHSVNPEPLLTSLRDELRKELGKEKVFGSLRWIALWKYENDYDKNQSATDV